MGDGARDPHADGVVSPGFEHRRVVEAALARLPLPRRARDRRPSGRRAAGLRRCLSHLYPSLPRAPSPTEKFPCQRGDRPIAPSWLQRGPAWLLASRRGKPWSLTCRAHEGNNLTGNIVVSYGVQYFIIIIRQDARKEFLHTYYYCCKKEILVG